MSGLKPTRLWYKSAMSLHLEQYLRQGSVTLATVAEVVLFLPCAGSRGNAARTQPHSFIRTRRAVEGRRSSESASARSPH